MIKRKFNEREICPLCGSDNLTYDSLKLYDNYISYPVTCDTCGCSFEEDYDLVYSSQNCILTKDMEEVD